MKISTTFAFFTLLSVASAASLRTAGSAHGDPAQVQVVVPGLKQQASPDESQAILDAATQAYNDVYEPAGYSIDLWKKSPADAKADNEKNPNSRELYLYPTYPWDPDYETWPNDFMWYFNNIFDGWSCRFCPPDDDTVGIEEEEETHVHLLIVPAKVDFQQDGADTTLDLGVLHRAFEETFCAQLRQSGIENLADVRDCAFAFLNAAGQDTKNMPLTKGRPSESQLTMKGTLHEFSDTEIQMIDNSVKSAFSEAFGDDYKLDNFKAEGWYNAPAQAGGLSNLILASGTDGWWPESFLCRWCPVNDDTVDTDPVSDKEKAFMHHAFEKALCTKLQNSGSANFANVHDCNFRFVLNPGDSVAKTVE